MFSADEDSNLASPDIQVRRKIVNRIEDSDSDIGSPGKPTKSSFQNQDASAKEHTLKYLTAMYPQEDVLVSKSQASRRNYSPQLLGWNVFILSGLFVSFILHLSSFANSFFLLDLEISFSKCLTHEIKLLVTYSIKPVSSTKYNFFREIWCVSTCMHRLIGIFLEHT